MGRVAISKNVLTWAIERSGVSLGGLEKKFPAIRLWETGEVRPTLRQLESFARATLTPLGFLFLREPPEQVLPIPYFRTITDKPSNEPSPNLIETVQLMQRRQAWLRDYLVEEGNEPLPFIHAASADNRPGEVARRMRESLGFDQDWASRVSTWEVALRMLRAAMEEAGITVVVNGIVGNNTHRKLDTDEFRGFVLVDQYAPLVFVNGADAKAAQMFTLAHELVHIWFGSSAAFDLREMQPAEDRTEQACNAVAAEFLVPQNEFRRIWAHARDFQDSIRAIARHFKVSGIVAARRALDLNLIRRNVFLDFYRSQQDREHRRGSKTAGGDFYATQDLRLSRRFARVIINAAREGKVLYNEAYQLTGLYGKTFERYATSLELKKG